MERPSSASIPTTPGVYLYKDEGGRIIYVGKALNLRKRVLSYFRPPAQLTPKTVAMIGHARSLETLSTTTEKEALLLEASLIKKHRPRYNIVLRDDKQYVLFRLSAKDEFPRLEIVRSVRKRDGARYFGPFTSGQAARETWKSIHRIFPLRRCSDRAMRNRVKPCLYHHIGLCLAPCTGQVTAEDYAAMTQRVALLLAGKSRELIDMLQEQMQEASDKLDFERAASCRDQIRAIEKTIERQAVVLQHAGDIDVLGLTTMNNGLGLGIIFVRQGRMLDRNTFFWPGLGLEEAGELIQSFLGQFYGPDSAVPPRIVIPWLPHTPQAEHLDQASQEAQPAAMLPTHQAAQDFQLSSAPEASQDAPALLASGVSGSSEQPDPLQAAQAAPLMPSDQAENLPAQLEDAVSDSEEALNTLAALEASLAEIRGGPVHIAAPRNAEEHRLVDMAKSNAREAARNRADIPLSQRLATVFSSPQPLSRIECVDVSHTGGQATKVGVVVYEEGKARKDDYRVWNIDDAGGDDYAALSAWALRRFEHGEPWPDLLLVDGGKGQVAAVDKVFRECFASAELPPRKKILQNAAEVGENAVDTTPEKQSAKPTQEALVSLFASTGPQAEHPLQPSAGRPFVLAGIAKARDEMGRADRRAGNVADRIFLPGRSNPLPLREGSAELLFLQAVRDAAHDFSIGRHRQARAKMAFSGELQRLPGIGPHTAKLLWEHFDSVEEMRQASLERLSALPGIGRKKAGQIHSSLQSL